MHLLIRRPCSLEQLFRQIVFNFKTIGCNKRLTVRQLSVQRTCHCPCAQKAGHASSTLVHGQSNVLADPRQHVHQRINRELGDFLVHHVRDSGPGHLQDVGGLLLPQVVFFDPLRPLKILSI